VGAATVVHDRREAELPALVLAGLALALFVGSATAATLRALNTQGSGLDRFLLASSGFAAPAALDVLAAGVLVLAHRTSVRARRRSCAGSSAWP
jgi:hypothetical protein